MRLHPFRFERLARIAAIAKTSVVLGLLVVDALAEGVPDKLSRTGRPQIVPAPIGETRTVVQTDPKTKRTYVATQWIERCETVTLTVSVPPGSIIDPDSVRLDLPADAQESPRRDGKTFSTIERVGRPWFSNFGLTANLKVRNRSSKSVRAALSASYTTVYREMNIPMRSGHVWAWGATDQAEGRWVPAAPDDSQKTRPLPDDVDLHWVGAGIGPAVIEFRSFRSPHGEPGYWVEYYDGEPHRKWMHASLCGGQAELTNADRTLSVRIGDSTVEVRSGRQSPPRVVFRGAWNRSAAAMQAMGMVRWQSTVERSNGRRTAFECTDGVWSRYVDDSPVDIDGTGRMLPEGMLEIKFPHARTTAQLGSDHAVVNGERLPGGWDGRWFTVEGAGKTVIATDLRGHVLNRMKDVRFDDSRDSCHELHFLGRMRADAGGIRSHATNVSQTHPLAPPTGEPSVAFRRFRANDVNEFYLAVEDVTGPSAGSRRFLGAASTDDRAPLLLLPEIPQGSEERFRFAFSTLSGDSSNSPIKGGLTLLHLQSGRYVRFAVGDDSRPGEPRLQERLRRAGCLSLGPPPRNDSELFELYAYRCVSVARFSPPRSAENSPPNAGVESAPARTEAAPITEGGAPTGGREPTATESAWLESTCTVRRLPYGLSLAWRGYGDDASLVRFVLRDGVNGKGPTCWEEHRDGRLSRLWDHCELTPDYAVLIDAERRTALRLGRDRVDRRSAPRRNYEALYHGGWETLADLHAAGQSYWIGVDGPTTVEFKRRNLDWIGLRDGVECYRGASNNLRRRPEEAALSSSKQGVSVALYREAATFDGRRFPGRWIDGTATFAATGPSILLTTIDNVNVELVDAKAPSFLATGPARRLVLAPSPRLRLVRSARAGEWRIALVVRPPGAAREEATFLASGGVAKGTPLQFWPYVPAGAEDRFAFRIDDAAHGAVRLVHRASGRVVCHSRRIDGSGRPPRPLPDERYDSTLTCLHLGPLVHESPADDRTSAFQLFTLQEVGR